MTRRKSRIERLEDALCDLGFGVERGAVKPVSGYWKKQDVFRWEARLHFEGRVVQVSSWETVSDCVRFGIEMHREDGGYSFEISSKRGMRK